MHSMRRGDAGAAGRAASRGLDVSRALAVPERFEEVGLAGRRRRLQLRPRRLHFNRRHVPRSAGRHPSIHRL